MKKLGILCLVMMLLVGCSQTEKQEALTSGEEASMNSLNDTYYKIINVDRSDLSERFYLDFYDLKDFEIIGRDLQILSSDYFSTSSHYMSEGQYITLDKKKELVQRSSEYSLQPQKGTTIEGISNPIMVSTVQEQDYYVKDGSKYTLKGISLAIIIDPKDENNHTLSTPMSDATIKDYGEGCIEKLYNFIQNTSDFEKIKNLPLLITVYQAADRTQSTTNGRYIFESYCQNGLGEIKSLNHKNVVFSSSEAEEIDVATASEFNEIKNNLKNAATEAAGFVGEAKYIDNEIQSMVIEANLNIKTYTELLYLTSLIADNIDTKFSHEFDIKVLVNSQDGLKAMIIKEKGQDVKSHLLY